MGDLVRDLKQRWRLLLGKPVRTGGVAEALRQHFYDVSPHHHANMLAEESAQRGLLLQYAIARKLGMPLPDFDDIGFRVFSQFNEDGILLCLFATIGAPSRLFVEIGSDFSGSPVYRIPQNNTLNLAINHDWMGLVIDGDQTHVNAAEHFMRRSLSTQGMQPVCRQALVTRENIDTLIGGAGVEGEIDFFSLDVDGVDYWLWEALTVVSPRVVVVEYNRFWRTDDAVTVPYAADFVSPWGSEDPVRRDFFGASLPAFVKLGDRKGYRLVGFNIYRNNAFFMLRGVGEEWFPEVDWRRGFEGTICCLERLPDRPRSAGLGWERV
jgi:hypothetical protein